MNRLLCLGGAEGSQPFLLLQPLLLQRLLLLLPHNLGFPDKKKTLSIIVSLAYDLLLHDGLEADALGEVTALLLLGLLLHGLLAGEFTLIATSHPIWGYRIYIEVELIDRVLSAGRS